MKKCLILLFMLFAASPSWAAITYVSQSSGSNGSTSSTTIASAGLNVTTGNFIVVFIGASDTSHCTVSSVTDTAGNTYHQATGAYKQDNAYDNIGDIWYAYNVTGNASNVVTATISTSTPYAGITQAQFSGVNTTSSVFDVATNGASDSSSTVTSSSFTPAGAGELLFAGVNVSASYTSTAGSGFTLISAGNGNTEYNLSSSSGSQTASFGVSNSGAHALISVAAFLAGSGGGGSTTTVTINNATVNNATIN